ncbi:Probable RNA-directed DNA polymerase from transposon BS [Eumeta japonica]|uniref:Probable RNA-directed DNA polymerase from transposon BS n=1 Tax=Eumeta variegata TaxID=151549 RepID=A0A4C1T722_EUMVA|nr:Probable RNA-directed DNA polymerase from transposon BS [Eumeta japonica]
MTSPGTLVIVLVYFPSPKKFLQCNLKTLLALEDAVTLFDDFNCKIPRCGFPTTNYNGDKLNQIEDRPNFEIIAPSTSTYYPDIATNTPSTLYSALTKRIVPLTNHVRKVVEKSGKEVPASSDRRNLPADVLELTRAKNASLRRASACPTAEHRSRTQALQRRVKARVEKVLNKNWSNFMEDVTPSHKAFWKVTKTLKTDGFIPIPPLKKPDNSIALDDVEIAECLTDSIESQCSHASPSHDITHIQYILEEVQNKAPLGPKNDQPLVSLSEVKTLVKSLKTKKTPGLDSNKAIKFFSLPLTSSLATSKLLGLLVAIFNACLRNCYFPPIWKETEVIGIYKRGKPRDLPAAREFSNLT